ncbi:MAG: ubiquitin-conjugating enzyme E2 [Tepidisphaeraceae bacterium]|jgi:ubiquitin-protein ligase
MIRFVCPGCGRKFNVPNHYAGKRALCKTCAHAVVVPQPTEMPPVQNPAQSSAKLPVRTRRLIADLRQMGEAFRNGPIIHMMDVAGDPAEVYKIEFNVRGIEALKSKQPVFRDRHVAEIRLTSDYPRLAPACRMLTPIFHPNIDESAICVGDHWVAGERLIDLVVRIGQMIAYQEYNIKSPLNGEAAMWADLNPDALPVDARDLFQ